MKTLSTALAGLALTGLLAPAAAHAQTSKFDLHPQMTQDEFNAFATEAGTMLRFRQLGDTMTLARGKVDLGVQFANTSSKDATRSVVARFGLNDRMDIGAWGGIGPGSSYGVVGIDTKIALLKQSPSMPVSVSVRPSISSLVGASDVWAGNTSVDLTVSRAFGPFSPYGGVAASSSAAMERSAKVDFDAATAGETFSYAGVTYRWKTLFVSGEAERGNQTTYSMRVGTRF